MVLSKKREGEGEGKENPFRGAFGAGAQGTGIFTSMILGSLSKKVNLLLRYTSSLHPTIMSLIAVQEEDSQRVESLQEKVRQLEKRINGLERLNKVEEG